MRRVMLLLSALLALSACTPGGSAPPPLAAPFELQVGFSPGGLADTIYGEFMAEKAMIPRDRILNRLSVDEMEKYLWQKKKNRKK